MDLFFTHPADDEYNGSHNKDDYNNPRPNTGFKNATYYGATGKQGTE